MLDPERPGVACPGVSALDIEEYCRDGVICVRRAFDESWIESLCQGIEEMRADPGPYAETHGTPETGLFFEDFYMWRRNERFRRFVFESPAAALVALVIGAQRLNFFYDQLLVKEPGALSPTPWHQDQPYWAVQGDQVCSLWLALDDVPKETSVHYLRGSHRWGMCFNPIHFSDGTPYADRGLQCLPDINANLSRYDIAAWDMEPGDCLIFHAMIVHGTIETASLKQRRRALATRWTGEDARFARHSGEVAVPHWDPGLRDGDPLDCADFPLVWSKPQAERAKS